MNMEANKKVLTISFIEVMRMLIADKKKICIYSCVPVTFTIEGSGVNWVSVKDETGIEIPLGNVKAYAEAIDKLLSDNELCLKYSSAGKNRISRMFTSTQSIIEMNKILSQLVSDQE
jgi:rhamnosyl/mannosyltransferase